MGAFIPILVSELILDSFIEPVEVGTPVVQSQGNSKYYLLFAFFMLKGGADVVR